jgi:hypothetical protein
MEELTDNENQSEDSRQKLEVVASVTLTKNMIKRAALESILASDQNREALKDMNLTAHYQFNPYHDDAFCLVTLVRDPSQTQELQADVSDVDDDDSETSISTDSSSD